MLLLTITVVGTPMEDLCPGGRVANATILAGTEVVMTSIECPEEARVDLSSAPSLAPHGIEARQAGTLCQRFCCKYQFYQFLREITNYFLFFFLQLLQLASPALRPLPF